MGAGFSSERKITKKGFAMENVIFNTHDVVLLMTAYQCIVFSLLLLTIRREQKLSNIFLAGFLLMHAAIPLDILIQFGAEFRRMALSWSPDIFYLFGFGTWLEAPLLLWYTRSLVYQNYKPNWRDLWLLLPFFIYLVYRLVSYYGLDEQLKIALQEDFNVYELPPLETYIPLLRDLFRVWLSFLCLIELRNYRKRLRHEYSDVEKRELAWLRLLAIGFLAIRAWSVLVVFLVMLAVVFDIQTDFGSFGLAGNYSTFMLVTLLIFYGLRNSLMVEGLGVWSTKVTPEEPKDKFKPEQVAAVSEYMEQEKPYLIPDLTLESLAGMLQMTPRTLSSIINRQFNSNFFEYVNAYRVEEAKHHLSDQANASKNVLDIMYDVGFRSKTTFNTLFKKKVGMTPTEYRKLASTK
jgi:AraC-like DNA-binding protein